MACTACDEVVPEGARFCPACGQAVTVDQPTVPLPDADTSTVESVKRYAKDVAHEAQDLSKAALKSDLGKKMAAGAGVGALLAVPIPFVGPAVGAVVGAGIVAFKRFTKD